VIDPLPYTLDLTLEARDRVKMNVGFRCSAMAIALMVGTQTTQAGRAAQGDVRVFVGTITDSLCANNGPHAQHMNEPRRMERDKRSCVARCVEMGGKLVLVESGDERIYQLDSPEKALPFAGQKVRITGTVHKNEITLQTIENIN